MTERSNSFMQFIPLEEKISRLAQVYKLILSFPALEEEDSHLEEGVVVDKRYVDESELSRKEGDPNPLNKNAGPSAEDDKSRLLTERVGEPRSNLIIHEDKRGEL